MALAGRIDGGYLGLIPQLTLLAPDIAEAVRDGRRPTGHGMSRPPESLPADWRQDARADPGEPRMAVRRPGRVESTALSLETSASARSAASAPGARDAARVAEACRAR
jgi:hypothetical protein